MSNGVLILENESGVEPPHSKSKNKNYPEPRMAEAKFFSTLLALSIFLFFVFLGERVGQWAVTMAAHSERNEMRERKNKNCRAHGRAR